MVEFLRFVVRVIFVGLVKSWLVLRNDVVLGLAIRQSSYSGLSLVIRNA